QYAGVASYSSSCCPINANEIPINVSDNQKKPRNHRRTSAAIKWLHIKFRVLETIWPALAARQAYRLWFSTPRFKEPSREAQWRQSAEVLSMEHELGPISVYRWGQGPVVVLVHGWSGRGPQLGAFAAPLVKKGFSVVAFDAPGHGQTPGDSTNVFQLADVLTAVNRKYGPATAVVAHSFGVVVSVYAMSQGLGVDKAVCISAPTDPAELMHGFCEFLHIGARSKRLLMQMMQAEFGETVWRDTAARNHAIDFTVPALIIHDENDRDVPWQWGRRLADHWPGSYFMRTKGLGHTRLLRHPNVVNAVVDFLVDDKFPQ
ncbi:alpha/beta hydrolase, partial [Kaarinaea lacus]